MGEGLLEEGKSVVDFTRYQPPGVVIQEDLVPLTAPATVAPTVVALVGPGIGYKEATEQITLNGTTMVRLRNLGINPSSVVVTDVGANTLAASGYTLTVGAGADGTIGNPQDNTLDIARNGTAIPDGSVVFVAYQFTDASYFVPQVIEDAATATALYGDAMDLTTGITTSPLTLAATLAFVNGANEVVTVATPTPVGNAAVTQAQLQAGYNLIADDPTVNVVVPLFHNVDGSGILALAQDLKTHVEATSNDGHPRVGLIGAGPLVLTDIDTTLSLPLASKRIVVFDPNRLNYFVGALNSTVVLGGYYLAAGAAGRLAALRVQDPLTKKEVRGFSGLVVTKSNTLKNRLSQNGVAVAEVDRNGRLVIRHGRTTNGMNVLNRELSMVRCRDALVTMLQMGMDAADMIGTPITIDTPLQVKGQVAGILETAMADGVIIDYTSLQVRQQVAPGGDPTIIDVKFAYKPSYPLNYIVITFSVDLSSGETDLTAA